MARSLVSNTFAARGRCVVYGILLCVRKRFTYAFPGPLSISDNYIVLLFLVIRIARSKFCVEVH